MVASMLLFFVNFNKCCVKVKMVEIICIIFSTFATLIYDEIIVIKKWGLDKDVATEIVKRAELEINAIGLLSSDNDDEEESE